MINNSVKARLDALERQLGQSRPAMLITFKDGHTALSDAGEAILMVRAGEPVAKVESLRGSNGMIADLLTGLCMED